MPAPSPLFVHFKTIFDDDQVFIMNEEDLTEHSMNEMGVTEFWFETVDDNDHRI